MIESITISTLLIIIYIFYISNKTNLILIETNGNKVLVRNLPDSMTSSILLEILISKMYRLRNNIEADRLKFVEMDIYITQMCANFNKDRTKIYETDINSELTSYSINKGEEIVFCLRCKKTHQLHNINLLMYVAVHEMAHTACPEIGHTPLFNNIFKFLLEQAVIHSLYIYENYYINPVQYCGMELYSNILN